MKRTCVDIILTVLLVFLMAYQVTGEMLHEWIGILMTVMVILHQVLNRKWYTAFFKGKHNLYRTVSSIINAALLVTFVLTAFCGMSMSGHAVPFLYGMADISFARRFHLAMSHWAFVLMGIHIGLHFPAIFSRIKMGNILKTIIYTVFAAAAVYGFVLFIKTGMPDYMFFRVSFVFFDYGKAKVLVILENAAMLCFWSMVGFLMAKLCRIRSL